MARPKRLNICGKLYKVRYFKNRLDVDPESNEPLWGACHFNNREIRIYSGADGPDLMDTVIHEITHAILHEHQVLLAMVGEPNEEAFVNDLASAITDCLIRNKLVRGDLFG